MATSQPIPTRPRAVSIISVHMDLGAGRRGVDMGPNALRVAGLGQRLARLGLEVVETGSVLVPEPELCDIGDNTARYLREIVDCCTELRDRVLNELQHGRLPLVLGGDHSIAIGSIAGQAVHQREHGGQPVGLIWMDAHADMNLPDSSPSGNIHGMPLAACLGLGLPALTSLAGSGPAVAARHVSIVGARDLDRREREIVRSAGVRVFTMSEIDERGMGACMDEAIARASDGTAGIHLSFDLDGVDPRFAPGVGTPVPGGLTYREAHLGCEKVALSGRLLGMDVVEINPVLDTNNATAELGVELILSAFGKTIL